MIVELFPFWMQFIFFFLQQSPIAEGDEEEKTNGNPVSKSVHPLVLL